MTHVTKLGHPSEILSLFTLHYGAHQYIAKADLQESAFFAYIVSAHKQHLQTNISILQ